MPPKSAAPPTVNRVEQDFHNAMDRLSAGQPTHPGLKKKQSAGKLKINIANVALEAGRSRTLIGTENCGYPAVRMRILELKDPILRPTDSMTVITRLRQEVAELREKLHYQQDEMKAYLNARRAAEKDRDRYKSAYERLFKSAHRNDDDKVVALSPRY